MVERYIDTVEVGGSIPPPRMVCLAQMAEEYRGFLQEDAEVVDQYPLIVDHFVLTLRSPKIAEKAEPGQFMMLRTSSDTYDPFLRRPMSIMNADKKEKTVQVYYKAVGKGTQGLAHAKEGTKLDMLGPLGNGFLVNPEKSKIPILIAGGYGVAPLYYLTRTIRKENKKGTIYALLGARNDKLLAFDTEFSEEKCEVFISTDDGSTGMKGNVIDLLCKVLEREKDKNQLQIYACGPHPMMRAVALECIKEGIACQVSLEEAMGCGIGICVGCVYPAQDSTYKKVCTLGPVVEAREVKWS